jgi:hypothetical protein
MLSIVVNPRPGRPSAKVTIQGDKANRPYAAIGRLLGMSSAAVTVAVCRLPRRFAEGSGSYGRGSRRMLYVLAGNCWHAPRRGVGH